MRSSLAAEDEASALREVAAAPAIRPRDLTKVYPHSVLAVDRLSLDISRGEFFGLLGPNGAGKTTAVGKQAVAVKQIIGVVTQFNTLGRRLTAWENLYHHGRYFGLSRLTPIRGRN